MNLVLNIEGFESDWVLIQRIHGGVQYVFRFENNYGASVVKHSGSYGHEVDLWELAVLKFNNEYNNDFELDYDTPITCDVEGFRTDEDIQNLLTRIKEL